jgi:hypothetical protein
VSTIRFSDAVTALLAAYSAAAPLAGVTIADGPEPSAMAAADFVIVGHDGTLDEEGGLAAVTEAGSAAQEWMAFPAQRDESGAVNCVACSQTGDSNDLPARRARAQALVAACEDAAVAITGNIVFDGTVEVHFLSRQTPQGVAVMAVFTVGYAAPF